MAKDYGIYEQGARFTRDDFDPYKTIKYLFDVYGIELSKELEAEIKNNNVSEESLDYLCKELDVKPTENTLQSICVSALNPYELSDLFVSEEDVTFETDMVCAKLYSDVEGVFMFDDEDRVFEDVTGECLMLCFNIPYVWNIREALIPGDKRIAVFQLQESAKALLKDDIDWEKRLGCFYAAGISM